KIKEELFDEVISTLPSHVLLKIEWVGIKDAHLFGIEGKPTFEHIKLWPKSIPIPDSTMDARIKAASTLGLKNKGLFLKGAHISGAPLPNCLNP
ncbi:MAG: hypothetical protein EBS13_01035, partial [Verrucomicrobia bacterium]|nr:hypothetical protein [Verrucomicrobiota bacterium]